MPLIGIYRGRDKTDNTFKQEYVLTLIPLGISADGPIPIFSPAPTKLVPLTSVSSLGVEPFGVADMAVVLPLGAGAQVLDTFGSASMAAVLPLSAQGGT
jgi:hypothetical protein